MPGFSLLAANVNSVWQAKLPLLLTSLTCILAGNENLCPAFVATGRDANGGCVQYMTVAENFAYAIPEVFSDVQAASLLCAGAIGYRSLCLTGLKDGQRLGLTGFGASAHLVLKMVQRRYPNIDTSDGLRD